MADPNAPLDFCCNAATSCSAGTASSLFSAVAISFTDHAGRRLSPMSVHILHKSAQFSKLRRDLRRGNECTSAATNLDPATADRILNKLTDPAVASQTRPVRISITNNTPPVVSA
jgi:hypothetical protein